MSSGVGVVQFSVGFSGKAAEVRFKHLKEVKGSQPEAIWGQSTSGNGPVGKAPGLCKPQKTAAKSGEIDLTALWAMVGLRVLLLGKMQSYW